jgi:hypothetical protein
MSSKLFFYCLKVWLVSVLIGPALFWCCLMRIDTDASYTFTEFLGFWGYGILYGLAFSLVSFLLFWGSLIYIYRRDWTGPQRRLATAFLGIVLTIVPFIIFFGTLNFFDESTRVAFCLSYLLPILGGIFIYRSPRPASKA